MYKSITISAIALCFYILSGCSEAKCWNKIAPEDRTCDYYSGAMLSRCHSSDGRFYLPNCHIVEHCTDYPAIDSGMSAETDSMDDTDTELSTDSDSETSTPTDIVCEYKCEGELISCDDITSESKCNSADHCEWYDDSID